MTDVLTIGVSSRQKKEQVRARKIISFGADILPIILSTSSCGSITRKLEVLRSSLAY